MKITFIKTSFCFLLLLNIASCQSQKKNEMVSIYQADKATVTSTYSPIPCKNVSSPLIKDKTKLKEMLFKEGKLSTDMTKKEVDSYVNSYIKSKSTKPCKSKVKQVVSIEETSHA